MANTTCWKWINTPGETETQLPKVTELGSWLKKLTAFFGSLDSDWFGSWEHSSWSTLQTLRCILLIVIEVVPLVCCILWKAFNSCWQLPITKQTISWRPECQKRNEENGQPKISKPEVVTSEYHRDSVKRSWLVNTTWRVSKNCKNSREVAGSRAHALHFDHISQLDWELDQKWAVIKNKSERDNRLQMESLILNAT